MFLVVRVRPISPVIALLLLLLVAPAAGAWQSSNPFAGANVFLNTDTDATRAAEAADAEGRSADAAALWRIARVPQVTWMIAADGVESGYVQEYFAGLDAAGPDAVPLIALHGLPQQACAGDNAPGHNTDADYRAWIDGWAARLSGRRSIVIVEPDGLAASMCMSVPDRNRRLALVRYAARVLGHTPGLGVYLDIGAGDWLTPATAVRLLRQSGVADTRGFALNVTHFDWTASEVAYGERLSRMLGGKPHYVVNTALNGRGPETLGRNFHAWCNPRGRSLGPLPTTNTAARHADAFAWLQNPGLSDGHCNGGPTVGTFWLTWALELANNSSRASDYPNWTHRRR
jgi:endoglucanase